jgi:Tol biopolymer transport system component
LHDYGPNNNFLGAFWFPDGQRILFSGIEPGHDARCYVQNINGGAPQPITPDGTICILISPDGKFSVAINPDQQAILYPVEGGSPVPIKGLSKGDIPIQWSADGRAFYVHQDKEMPNKIYLVNISTGQKTFWKELSPPDTTGLLYLGPVLITPDGKSYVYSYGRNQSDLYLASGLK